MYLSLAKTLEDGTKVAVEHRSGGMAQLIISKGRVHRSIGLTLPEAQLTAELLNMLPKPETTP